MSEVDAVDVEFHVAEVDWIVARSLEVGYAVVAPHVPRDGLAVAQQHLGQGGGPASAAHYGNMDRAVALVHAHDCVFSGFI